MAINLQAPPAAAFAVATDGIAQIEGGDPIRAELGGAPPAAAPQPFPIYLLQRDQISPLLDIEHEAKLSGWRFLVDRGPEGSFVDVHQAHKSAKLTFGQSSAPGNLVAPRLLDAAHRAEKMGETQDYDARILDVPGVHAVALWLHGQVSKFIAILPTTMPRDAMDEAAFVRALTALVTTTRGEDPELGG